MLNFHLATVYGNYPYVVESSVNAGEGRHHLAEHKSIQKIAESLAVAKSTNWYILKKRKALTTAMLKGLEKHRRKLKWMIAEFFPG